MHCNCCFVSSTLYLGITHLFFVIVALHLVTLLQLIFCNCGFISCDVTLYLKIVTLFHVLVTLFLTVLQLTDYNFTHQNSYSVSYNSDFIS